MFVRIQGLMVRSCGEHWKYAIMLSCAMHLCEKYVPHVSGLTSLCESDYGFLMWRLQPIIGRVRRLFEQGLEKILDWPHRTLSSILSSITTIRKFERFFNLDWRLTGDATPLFMAIHELPKVVEVCRSMDFITTVEALQLSDVIRTAIFHINNLKPSNEVAEGVSIGGKNTHVFIVFT